eukprot:12150022-Alexandrium_andersonii.AAC.1
MRTEGPPLTKGKGRMQMGHLVMLPSQAWLIPTTLPPLPPQESPRSIAPLRASRLLQAHLHRCSHE